MTGVWIFFLFGVIFCIEFMPERIIIDELNPKYVRYFRAYVRRAGRRLPYTINVEMSLLYTLGNNVSVDIQFFEYLHNEYKPSFIQMKLRACDMLTDYLLGQFFIKAGFKCPVPAGNHTYYNITTLDVPIIENLPYKWPFEKGKLYATLRMEPDKDLVGKGSLFFIVKETKKSNKTVSKIGKRKPFL